MPVEGAEVKGETSAEAPEGEQPQEPKDAAKRAHSDIPGEEETSPQPAAKKKKPIFGGIFTRRKSKKSKGDLGSPPAETTQEKEGAKVDDEHQSESKSTEPTDDAKPQVVEEVETVENGTDQGGSSDTSQTTDAAQQEVTENVINPVADQAVESVKEEIADELEQEVQTATGGEEPGAKGEETVKTEDVQKSAEEPVQSTDADGTVDKEETEQQPVHSQDNQPEKKHSFFSEFFARRKSKKLKESSAETSQEKIDNVVEQQPSGNESIQAADDTKLQTVVTVQTLENGTDKDAAPETTDTTAGVQQQEVTEGAISPKEDQAVESAKEDIADGEKGDEDIAEQDGGAAAEGEPSGKVGETVVPEDIQKPAEEPLASTDGEEVPVQSQESQPEKKHSIFSGLFARRKSKKSKGDISSTPGERPQEKEGDQTVEEQQGGCASTQAADDVTPQASESEEKQDSAVTDEDAPPIDTSATVQQEVTEAVISPAVDQVVESAKEDIGDGEKVDENIAEQDGEAATEGEPSGKEEETVVPEDTQNPPEEPLRSKDADATVEKKEAEVPVQSQESQPEKKYSIFSGLFARRKSKKSKGDVSSTPGERPQEKEGDQAVEEQQGGSASTQAADDVTPQASESEEKQDSAVTEQDAPPIGTSATVQQEVTEVVISPAVDETVESAKDEIADKADGNNGEQETTSEHESSSKEVETTGTEDVKKSREGESEMVNHKPKVEEPSEDTSKETSGMYITWYCIALYCVVLCCVTLRCVTLRCVIHVS